MATKRKQRRQSPASREEQLKALALADKIGTPAAAEKLGIEVGRIYRWASLARERGDSLPTVPITVRAKPKPKATRAAEPKPMRPVNYSAECPHCGGPLQLGDL